MTSASSLHFGPEWMRKPSRGSLTSLSPNPTGNSPSATSNMLPTPPTQAAPALPNVSSYSSLLTSTSPPPEIKSEDESYPFRYSKDQMIRVWKDGGGRGGLGLEVERWPGIVREVGGEPVGVRDMTQEERKLFSMPVNSDPPARRNNNSLSLAPDRQSTKFGQGVGIGLGPVSPRGIGGPRRRGTGNADDPTSAPFLPRKLSLSSTLLAGNAGNGTPGSPGGPLSSPNTRTRMSALDGPDAADPWSRGPAAGGATDPGWGVMGARRRANDAQGARGWGGTAGTPMSGGLGIGRGMSLGNPTNGAASGNGGEHDKISPSASPGPGPVSDPDATASGPEGSTESTLQPGDTSIVDGSETSQSASTANTIYATDGPSAPVPNPPEDPANIQWSYKDPTGQIQGPFIGATMQQWFESGYFNDDLLIKRTTIDPDFEPLRDIRRRAAPARPGETYPQIFLSPLAPRAPPNLPPPQSHLLGNNPPLNPSPRLAHLMMGVSDPSNHGPMSAGVSGSSLAHSPALSATARSTTLDSYLSPSSSSEGLVAGSIASAALTNVALERKKREDFIQSLRERELAMSVSSPNQQTLGMSSPFGAGFVPNPVVHHPQYLAFGPGNPAIPSTFNTRLVPPPAPIHAPVSNATLGAVSPFPHNGPVLWSSSGGEQLNTPTSSFNSTSPSGFDHATIYQSVPGPAQQQQQQNSAGWLDSFAPQEASWGDDPSPPSVEAAVNVADEPLQTPISEWGVHDSPASAQPSLPAEPVESVADALEQTTIQPEPTELQESISEYVAEPEPALVPATVPAPAHTGAPAAPGKRKGGNKGKTTSATTTVVIIPAKGAVASSTPSPASPPPPSKAWATPDEDKPTSLSLRDIQEAEVRRIEARKAAEKVAKDKPTSLSLREIQEVEARQAEARKAAERAAKPAPPPPTSAESDESIQAVTGTWGLPQVGSRPAAPTPATNGAPAWTKPAAVPAGKKSMKEIQEEEEKRKKAAAAKEAQAIAAAQQAAKRAYAESTKVIHAPLGSSLAPVTLTRSLSQNVTASGASASGGAWTTVGAKSSGGSPAAARQPSSLVGQPATGAVRVVSSGSGASGPRPSSSASSTTQASAKPAKPSASAAVAEDAPVAPSLDFLKWLKEALKGLNGVNVEEFMQMLLSFPLDPSPAVIEIISDSIYANSSTLDGRRFAAEFCQKRKADAAAARTKVSSGSKAPARASLADVVKTQPKPVQSEWGFKTVQKKAKGGRK
ncbi:hypothetical protein FRC10_000184 [Ceratobasidium sp. 414]|nr:hypothetical protein FRC10_000184 [Ceratobasidium sp. 414]